jgi:hypothetical protein
MNIPSFKPFTLNGNGLFDASELNVIVDTSANMTALGTVTVAAVVTVYFDPANSGKPAVFSIEPIVTSIRAIGVADLDLVLGVVEFSSMASVLNVTVKYTVCYSKNTMSDCAVKADSRLGNSFLWMSSFGNYSVGGSLALVESVPGLTVPESGWTFKLEGNDILTNYVPSISVPNMADFVSLVRFSPMNLLQMLRQMEATIYRLHENERFLTSSIPLTDTTFAAALAPGSVFLTNQFEVATPQALSIRPKKSLTLNSSKAFDTTLSSSFNKTYQLVYTVGPDLLANPDDLSAVEALNESKICKFVFDVNMTSSEGMASSIVAKINGANCGVKACRLATAKTLGCTRDDISTAPTFDIRGACSSSCNVVIDTYNTSVTDYFMYITSVVNASSTTDVVLLSLNEQVSVRAGATNLYGFPVNQAATPELVPRSNSIGDFVHRLSSK